MQRYRMAVQAFILCANLCWLLSAVTQGQTAYFDLESKMNRKLADNLGSGAEGNTLAGVPVGTRVKSWRSVPSTVHFWSTRSGTYPAFSSS